MPTPSSWTTGVAAPSSFDPYVDMEAATRLPGGGSGVTVPSYAGGGGATLPTPVQTKGHWSEAFNPQSPAFWYLAAALIALGVLHLSGGVRVGKARVAVQA